MSPGRHRIPFTTYSYDDLGRLLSTGGDPGATTVQYDANGNRLQLERGAEILTSTFDQRDFHLTQGDCSFEYSARGHRSAQTCSGQLTTYQYDPLGNLQIVSLPDGRTIDYVLDARGRRIGKRVDSQMVQGFLYLDQINPVAELDAQGQITSLFVYGERIQVPSYMVKAGQTYKIVTDHLGSPRLVINVDTGVIAQQLEYDVFGRVLSDSNPGFQPFGFAGGLYDADTGLVHFGARQYDPVTGRWISADPLGFGGGSTNFFAYAFNDPVNRVDLVGLVTLEDVSNFTAGFGDSLTLGGTSLVRDLIGGNELIDKCSFAYSSGEWFQTGAETTLSLGGAALRRLAANASRRLVRNASRRLTRHIVRNGNHLHHRLPLFGHPGGAPALFPTGGLPAWFHSGPLNRTLVNPTRHWGLHRRLRQAEDLLRYFFPPELTLLRLIRLQLNDCPCK